MSNWGLWGVLLFIQAVAFTWVSRARNSGSVGYHSLASVFSNGVYIASMYFVVDNLQSAVTWQDKLQVGLFYTACTVAGASSMHWFSMKHLEKGTRKVGG